MNHFKAVLLLLFYTASAVHAFYVAPTTSSGVWRQHYTDLGAAPAGRNPKKYSFRSDQDQIDVNRADLRSTWTPADIPLYKIPPRLLNGDDPKQFIPSPGLKYGKPTMEQTHEQILDQIGALATKTPRSLPRETRSRGNLVLNDPRFGPKYPPWIQDC